MTTSEHIAERAAQEEARFMNCCPALTTLDERVASLYEELNAAVNPNNAELHRAVEEIAADLFLAQGAFNKLYSFQKYIRCKSDKDKSLLQRLNVRSYWKRATLKLWR